MDGSDSIPEFDRVDGYLFLIDEKFKTQIEGEPFLCVNPDRDLWQPIKSLPFGVLKLVAVRCVTERLQKAQKPPSFVVSREFKKDG